MWTWSPLTLEGGACMGLIATGCLPWLQGYTDLDDPEFSAAEERRPSGWVDGTYKEDPNSII